MFVVPLLVLVVLVAGLVRSFDGLTVLADGDVFPAESTRPAASATGALNVLLLGTDSLSGLGEEARLEDGGPTGQRADTMVVAHVPADRSGIYLVSLMRDLWVSVPGQGDGKLNSAFAAGGIPLTVQTIEGLLGARIDHVALVDFEGFAAISTALGGVVVDSPIAFESANMPGFSFSAGENRVAGDEALAFVRERYAFPDSDFQRVENQRSFLEGVFRGLGDSAGRLDVDRVTTGLSRMSDALVVDAGLDVATVASLTASLAGVSAEDIVSFTLRTRGTATRDGQSVVLPDGEAAAELGRAMAADGLAALAGDAASPASDTDGGAGR
jgi:LCP family protein required for cell wall assembly